MRHHRPPAFAVVVLASALWPTALAISAAVAGVDYLARRIHGGPR